MPRTSNLFAGPAFFRTVHPWRRLGMRCVFVCSGVAAACWRPYNRGESPIGSLFSRFCTFLPSRNAAHYSTCPHLILFDTDPGRGECSSKFRVSVNRLPFVAVLIPPHFASSFDDPCILKFSHSCLYFINHVGRSSFLFVRFGVHRLSRFSPSAPWALISPSKPLRVGRRAVRSHAPPPRKCTSFSIRT